MAITYNLAPNPKWYIADLVGRPLAGGYMGTFSNLDPTQVKLIFEDPAGQFPWPYIAIPNTSVTGILFDENGSQGPFYWEFDSSDPDDLYYVEVYDSNGVLQWTIDNFTPPAGGGGSIITDAIDLENLIANSAMYRNIGQSSNPINATFLTLAPGANTGLAATASNAGPDINFIKNNTAATDQLSFLNFTLGTTPFTGDVTPEQYLEYVCTNSPAGETAKYVQFPITSGVQNLTNQEVTITIWARVNSGVGTLGLQWLQFFGDGSSASAPLVTTIQTLNLTTSWSKFLVTTTVPSILGKTLGQCGNSGLFLQIQYPLGVACNIDFAKPSIYLGNISPAQDYHTYDMIDGNVNTARTGDIRTSLNSFAPFGWLAMNNGTIGSALSNASARANVDTFPLYNLIWNNVSSESLPLAPIFDSAGNASTLGASSIVDFSANKQLALTKALGQVLGGTIPNNFVPASQNYTANFSTSLLTVTNSVLGGFLTGTPVVLSNSGGSPPSGLSVNTIYYAIYRNITQIALALTLDDAIAGNVISFSNNGSGTNSIVAYSDNLGNFQGQKQHTLNVGEMPSHNHNLTPIGNADAGGGSHHLQMNANNDNQTSTSFNTSSTGGNGAHNNMQPTTFVNMFIKL